MTVDGVNDKKSGVNPLLLGTTGLVLTGVPTALLWQEPISARKALTMDTATFNNKFKDIPSDKNEYVENIKNVKNRYENGTNDIDNFLTKKIPEKVSIDNYLEIFKCEYGSKEALDNAIKEAEQQKTALTETYNLVQQAVSEGKATVEELTYAKNDLNCLLQHLNELNCDKNIINAVQEDGLIARDTIKSEFLKYYKIRDELRIDANIEFLGKDAPKMTSWKNGAKIGVAAFILFTLGALIFGRKKSDKQ